MLTAITGCTVSKKRSPGERQTQEILETNDGSLSRLLSVGGHPLDAQQQQKENERCRDW